MSREFNIQQPKLKKQSRWKNIQARFIIPTKTLSGSRKPHPENNIPSLINSRVKSYLWTGSYDFYLYVALLGNTVDGLPIAVHFANILSGGVYHVAHLMGCFMFGLPLIYIELFYGAYTRLTNIRLYGMAPLFFGYCTVVLLVNFFYLPTQVLNASQMLHAAVKLVVITNPLSCDKNAVECYDFHAQGKLNTTCTRVYKGMRCENRTEIVRHVLLYNSWMNMSENESVFLNWELALMSNFTWLAIVALVWLGPGYMGAFLRVAFITNCVIYIFLFFSSITETGTSALLDQLLTFNFQIGIADFCMAITFTMTQLGLILPYGYVTRTAYMERRRTAKRFEALFLVVLNMILRICYLTISGIVTSALGKAFGVNQSALITAGPALFVGTYIEFMSYRGVPILIMVIANSLFWLIEVSKLAWAVHNFLLNVLDCIKSLARYRVIIILTVGLTGAMISIMESFTYFINYVTPLMRYAEIQIERPFLVIIQSVLFFYFYGVNRISDDIHYTTGARLLPFWQFICLCYPVANGLLMLLSIMYQSDLMTFLGELAVTNKKVSGTSVSIKTIICEGAAMVLLTVIYVIINVCDHKPIIYFFKPKFYFGPPNSISRIGRKNFRPLLSMRSQMVQNEVIHYRVDAVRVKHRIDELLDIKRGHIFLEDTYKPGVRLTETLQKHDAFTKSKMFAQLQNKYTDRQLNK